jgi:hypothetical protein
MTTTDLVTIIGNFSQSLYPMQRLISGFAYLLGILFFITAIEKLKKIGGKGRQGSSQDHMYTPMMYMIIGAMLIYLPTALHIMANTAFGVGNVLTYSNYNSTSIYSSMGLLIRTAGILWFVRGSVLVAHASEPGSKDGAKGLVFILSGIIAMNFDSSVAMVNSMLAAVIRWTMTFKASQGF